MDEIRTFEAIENAYGYFEQRLEKAIKGDVYICYRSFPKKYRIYQNNIDEMAIDNKVQFFQELGSRTYESPVVEYPTWLQLAVFANDMIKAIGDFDHKFFEGYKIEHSVIPMNYNYCEIEIKRASFCMGSKESSF